MITMVIPHAANVPAPHVELCVVIMKGCYRHGSGNTNASVPVCPPQPTALICPYKGDFSQSNFDPNQNRDVTQLCHFC